MVIIVLTRNQTIKKEDNMGISPCATSITIEFECQFRVHLKDGSLTTDLLAFYKVLP